MSITLANDLIFKEIDTIDAFEIGTGDFMLSLDELTDYSIAHSEESQNVTGRNGRVLSRTKRNKGVKISGTNGIVSSGLLAIQTGGTFSTGATEIMWADYLTVTSNAATTRYKAIGTAGAEIVSLITKAADGSVAAELTQDTTAASGKFTYNPSSKALAFSGIADGTEIVVYYKRNISATKLTNSSDKYSGKAMLYVNGLAEDKCANVYRVQFFFPKVDFSGEFSLNFADSQTVHNFEAVAMAGACGAGTKFYTYTVFGANAADVVTT